MVNGLVPSFRVRLDPVLGAHDHQSGIFENSQSIELAQAAHVVPAELTNVDNVAVQAVGLVCIAANGNGDCSRRLVGTWGPVGSALLQRH
jgi:hypothetical protein